MTNPQTEARAMLDRMERAAMAYERLGKLTRDDEKTRTMRKETIAELASSRQAIVTALAAKDAELAGVKEMYAREGAKSLYELERAERAEAQLAEANKALEPFAALADIFDHRGGNLPTTGTIAQWSDHRVGDRELNVKHLRAARRAREAQGGE